MAVGPPRARHLQRHLGRGQLLLPAQPPRGGGHRDGGVQGCQEHYGRLGRGRVRASQAGHHRLRRGAHDPQRARVRHRLWLLQVRQLRHVLLAALLPLAPLRPAERQRDLLLVLGRHDAGRRHRGLRQRPLRRPPRLRDRHLHGSPRPAPLGVRHVLQRDEPHPPPRAPRTHGHPRGRSQQHHHLGGGRGPRRPPVHRRQHPRARHGHRHHQRLGLHHRRPRPHAHRPAAEGRRLDRGLVLPHPLRSHGHGPHGPQDLEGAHPA
mmetsp:Transcript_27527/g.92011  ORF Transcript_27527/g.92011 Transcript_27527/m.92011 type:complete len:264 (-) Transcript_27527:149-940(-)